MTERPGAGGGAEDSRAEEVLAQALRVMAGGGPKPGKSTGTREQHWLRRLSTGQLVLLAAIIGLLIGIGLGFLSLML